MTISSLSPIHFQAKWTPDLEYLNPANRSIARKVYEFVKSVVFFVPNFILEASIRLAVLPSSNFLLKLFLKESIENWKGNKNKIDLELKTPDHISLKGCFIKHKDYDPSNPNSRVIILFHGNGAIYQGYSWSWLGQTLSKHQKNYSFLLFNPRGVGESTEGYANSDNLLLDCETAYQFAVNYLKIPENRIDLYGHSLGGAEAAHLKALHPATGGRLYLDRTFENVEKEALHFLKDHYSFIKKLTAFLLRKFHWTFDNYKALTKIKDPVHVFHHRKDAVIPKDCSLAQAVLNNNPHPETLEVHEFDDESYKGSAAANKPHLEEVPMIPSWHMAPLTTLTLVDDAKGRNCKKLLQEIF
jgi:pimeloyl-ACP methyl ester carboxylesterase